MLLFIIYHLLSPLGLVVAFTFIYHFYFFCDIFFFNRMKEGGWLAVITTQSFQYNMFYFILSKQVGEFRFSVYVLLNARRRAYHPNAACTGES